MRNFRLPALLLCVATAALRAEEPTLLDKAGTAIKHTASEVAEGTKEAAAVTKEKSLELGRATKQGAEKAYHKTVEATKHAADVTKEKAVEVGGAVKEKSAEAYHATKEATKKAAARTAEATKETARAAAEKTRDLLTTKEDLARYDTNKDGRLDDAERARMKAAKDAATPPR
jgi:hypothetical protein